MPPLTDRTADRVAAGAVLVLLGWLLVGGLVITPGAHDNDWPLLMWLAFDASPGHLDSLAIGHIGPGQLLLVRWLWPLFGSTLVAAKVLSAVCTAGLGWVVYGIGKRLGGPWSGLAGLAFVATAPPAFLTGQSEFADPLALLPYVAGLALWLRGGPMFAAGILIGLGGCFRTHMQTFVPPTLGVVVVHAWLCRPDLPRLRRLRGPLVMACGMLLGTAPMIGLNLAVHGQPSSPVMSTLIGQVLYGVDFYDFYNTYALHPMSSVESAALLRFVAGRFRDNVVTWLLPLLLAGVVVVWRRRFERTVMWSVLALCVLALGYFTAFISPSWYMTMRLFLPVVVLMSIAGGVLLARLVSGGHPRLALLLALVFVGGRLVDAVPDIRGYLAATDRRWDRSTELTGFLRANGMRDPREAFVFDWNRLVVDDPRLMPFYNFGVWNLLIDTFRAERPLPTPYLDDAASFAAFMRAQNVKFIVLSKALDRFPALLPVVAGLAPLPGYRRAAEFAEDVVYREED